MCHECDDTKPLRPESLNGQSSGVLRSKRQATDVGAAGKAGDLLQLQILCRSFLGQSRLHDLELLAPRLQSGAGATAMRTCCASGWRQGNAQCLCPRDRCATACRREGHVMSVCRTIPRCTGPLTRASKGQPRIDMSLQPRLSSHDLHRRISSPPDSPRSALPQERSSSPPSQNGVRRRYHWPCS